MDTENGLRPTGVIEDEDAEVERLTREMLARKNKATTPRIPTQAIQPKPQQQPQQPQHQNKTTAPAQSHNAGSNNIPAWKQEQLEKQKKDREKAEAELLEKKKKLSEMKNAEELEADDPLMTVTGGVSSPRGEVNGLPYGSEEVDIERAKREEARLQKMIGGGSF